MTSPLANLEPKVLWNHFDQLRQIPRPSKQETAVKDHIVQWAKARKFECQSDTIGNLCVRVPASRGHESAKVVILQGHVDMVAEKDKATDFDFSKDAIPVRVDGDWVIADHTTLGADNGIGVAAAMAAADDPSIIHGPLELLFTIDEETGLTGAINLDGSMLTGRIMLNLDSEEDGTLFVGCAGGCTTEAQFTLVRQSAPSNMTPVRIEVTGLRGGHSGLNIHENRGCAIKVLARVLGNLWETRIHSIEGGNKHNAIAREASAIVYLPSGQIEEARKLALKVQADVLTEIGSIDGGLKISVTQAQGTTGDPADENTSKTLIRLLTAVPHGVMAMSRDIVGLTESSTNLAVVRTSGDVVDIVTSSRSSVMPAMRAVVEQGTAVLRLAGATYNVVGEYPGWQPQMGSALLGICKEVFLGLYGRQPKVTAIHAGLECGLIGEKLGGADMISFGPQLEGVHAPGEKVNIPSVVRFWDFFKAVLRNLA